MTKIAKSDRVLKSGWTRQDLGHWNKVIKDFKYDLDLFCRPQDDNYYVFAQIKNRHHMPPSILFTSPKLGTVSKDASYSYIVRKFVRQAHRWANEQFATPMDLLSDAVSR